MLRRSQRGHWDQLVCVLPKWIPAGSSWNIRITTWSLLCIWDLHRHCIVSLFLPPTLPRPIGNADILSWHWSYTSLPTVCRSFRGAHHLGWHSAFLVVVCTCVCVCTCTHECTGQGIVFPVCAWAAEWTRKSKHPQRGQCPKVILAVRMNNSYYIYLFPGLPKIAVLIVRVLHCWLQWSCLQLRTFWCFMLT